MRFGKRPRTARLFGRKSPDEAKTPAPPTPEDATYEPVQNDERSALVFPHGGDLSGDAPEDEMCAEATMDSRGEQNGMGDETGREGMHDPTNRLLTALGRFHREVLKAREGGAHTQWPDICMNQLIGAVEIALAQGWDEVVEALGDTGRVLQSYSEAGRAGHSVAFLEDAYEILCLMVGDLIVGSVRAGVVQKWSDRYRRAVEDLEAEGLRLVDDEEAGGSAPPVTRPAETATADRSFEPLPSLDELAPLEDELETQTDASTDEDAEDSGSAEPRFTALLDTVSEALALIEQNPAVQHPAAFATIADAVDTLEQEARAEDRVGAAIASEAMLRLCEGAQQVEGLIEDRFFELAYAFPGLYAEADGDGADAAVDQWLVDCEDLLTAWSSPATPDASPTLPATPPADEPLEDDPFDAAALEAASLAREQPDPSEIDLPDLDAELTTDPPDAIEEAVSTSGEVSDADAARAVAELLEAGEEVPEPSIGEAPSVEHEALETLDVPAEAIQELVEEQIDTPQQILKVAQQAVTEGRAANAKLLLLQAAASIAETEALESEEAVERIAGRIQDEAQAIEAAMRAVTEAEAAVTEAEQTVSSGSEELSAGRERIEERTGEVAAVESRITTIDEEIRALEARRAEEVATLEAAQRALAEAEQAVSDSETALAAREASEVEARQRLEETRARVKQHQRRRSEYETELDRMRAELRARSESLAELQQTIGRLGLGGPAAPNDAGDLFQDTEQNDNQGE